MKILTIAFNGYGQYLPRLLESIDAQTEKPDEVIIVLGKDHGYEWKKKKGIRVIETNLTCLGSLINVGMEYVNDWVLYFSADDVLYPNAIEEIKKVDADIVTLKYHLREELKETPEISLDKLKDWKEHYMWASGYFAFPKQKVLESDFWKYPLLFKAASQGKTIKPTENPCAKYIQREKSHGAGQNIWNAMNIIGKYAEKYSQNPKISVFSIVKDEEDMCEEAWESVKDADELVICIDDRTKDKTPEIAKKFTDKIYYFKWEDDFAKAKNFAMSKCTGDWIMGIDGDCILKGGIEKIRHAVKETECDMVDVTLHEIGAEWRKHALPKIFKNGIIKYKGMAHEFPSGGKRDLTDYGIEIEYGYSPNHKKDPDRYTRILKKQIKEDPQTPRWKFYLAREYFYKQDYKRAIRYYKQYIKTTKFLAEKADAYLYLARCYWIEKQGDKARECTLKAIEINPNFKEALLFMSQIVWPRHSQRWQDFAQHADNSEVLFIRV